MWLDWGGPGCCGCSRHDTRLGLTSAIESAIFQEGGAPSKRRPRLPDAGAEVGGELVKKGVQGGMLGGGEGE